MSQIKNLTPHRIVILDPSCCEFNSKTRSYNLVKEIVIQQVIEPDHDTVVRCSTFEVEQSSCSCQPDDDGYYSINSADILLWFSEKASSDETVKAKLVKDIDMSEKEWTPIGNEKHKYSGAGGNVRG